MSLLFGLISIYSVQILLNSTSNFERTTPDTKDKQLIHEGYQLLDKGKFDQAEAKFDEARRLTPKSAEPWYAKAKVSLAKQNRPVALQYIDKALKINSKHEPSLVLKIKVLLSNGGSERIQAKTIVDNIGKNNEFSDDLNQWVNCLKYKKVFSKVLIVETELDQLCYFSNSK